MATLLSVKRTASDTMHCFFEARFDEVPTLQQVAEAQEAARYHPAGYGLPTILSWRFVGVEQTCLVVFRCSASCE